MKWFGYFALAVHGRSNLIRVLVNIIVPFLYRLQKGLNSIRVFCKELITKNKDRGSQTGFSVIDHYPCSLHLSQCNQGFGKDSCWNLIAHQHLQTYRNALYLNKVDRISGDPFFLQKPCHEVVKHGIRAACNPCRGKGM